MVEIHEVEIHEMELVAEHCHNWEEWYCYICNRHFMLLSWTNPFKRVILEDGDVMARHRGSKGDVEMGSTELNLSGLSAEMLDALEELDLDW